MSREQTARFWRHFKTCNLHATLPQQNVTFKTIRSQSYTANTFLKTKLFRKKLSRVTSLVMIQVGINNYTGQRSRKRNAFCLTRTACINKSMQINSLLKSELNSRGFVRWTALAYFVFQFAPDKARLQAVWGSLVWSVSRFLALSTVGIGERAL